MSPEILALLALALPQDSAVQAPATRLEGATYYRERQRAEDLYAQRDWAQAVPLYLRLTTSCPSDGESWRRLAVGHYYLGQYSEASTAFERSLELGFGRRPGGQFSLACCYALSAQPAKAFASLEASLAAGLVDRTVLAEDGDLSSLHDDARWQAAIGSLPERELDRDERWRFDLDFLVAEAQRLHADPERPAHAQRFLSEAAELRKILPELADDRIMARLMRLVAVLDDGHSVLYGPGPDSELELERRVLPFRFYAFPDGLYIIDGHGESAQHAGKRVVRFGELLAEQVLERMAAYRGVDNPMTWTWMGPQFYVRRLSMLQEVGAALPGEPVELTLLTPNGEEQRVSIEGGDFDLVRKLRPSPVATGEVPRYLSAVDTNYWMEPLPGHGALYLQFNQVRDDEHESISAFAERLRRSSADVDVLIVDVRHNNGGNNSLVRPLIRAVIEFEMKSPERRVFVITGRNTFSAAQNFINRLERWTDAIFVGEPSSSSPNFVGEETELVLPYSRLRGSLSTHYWQDSDPGDDRAWIAPHVPVELTAADYFSGADPALDAVLELIADD